MNDNRDNEHCAPVARPGTKAGVPLVLTRRQLLRAGLGGVSLGTALLIDPLLSPQVARSVPVNALPVTLRPFLFDVVTVNAKGQVVSRKRGTAKCFAEELGQGVGLDMVSIPGRRFVMGSSKTEEGSDDHERPQHLVSVRSFFMSQYPVTQAQWTAVAVLPQVKQQLDPDPSLFKGANRPVDQVSWYDAVEFCARLSQHTGKPYHTAYPVKRSGNTLAERARRLPFTLERQ